MSTSHLEAKSREALNATRGNRALATQLLFQWASEDPKLLGALVRPVLKSLCMLAIQRAFSRIKKSGRGAAVPQARSSGFEGTPLDAAVEALSGRARVSMTSTRGPDTRPKEGSPRHKVAMEALAKAFGPKKER